MLAERAGGGASRVFCRTAFSAINIGGAAMPETIETVKFYYDYKSPFTYLALEPTLDLERSYRLRVSPIPLEVDIRAAYGGDLTQRPERDWDKVRYLYADARRFARERGIIIRGPQKLFDSHLALIGGLYADAHGRFREFSLRVFERFFKRELDLEDSGAIAAVITEAGLEAADFRRYAASEGPAALVAARQEAERDGAFGVPTVFVQGEPFWGNDRIEWVIKKLEAMGLGRGHAA
jgi:2-hydroxychromene-2-carboxylate isomerase